MTSEQFYWLYDEFTHTYNLREGDTIFMTVGIDYIETCEKTCYSREEFEQALEYQTQLQDEYNEGVKLVKYGKELMKPKQD